MTDIIVTELDSGRKMHVLLHLILVLALVSSGRGQNEVEERLEQLEQVLLL